MLITVRQCTQQTWVFSFELVDGDSEFSKYISQLFIFFHMLIPHSHKNQDSDDCGHLPEVAVKVNRGAFG